MIYGWLLVLLLRKPVRWLLFAVFVALIWPVVLMVVTR